MTARSDVDLEFSILRTICRETVATDVRTLLLPKLTPYHFESVTSQNLYRRIKYVLEKDHSIPSWEYLLKDPGVRKETRQAMKQIRPKSFKNTEAIRNGFRLLDTYRQVRGFYNLGVNLEEGLENDTLNLESIKETLSKDLQMIVDGSQETPILNFGVDGNADSVVKKLLTKGGPPRIPTGFKSFDDVNRGIPRGALFLIGGPTGGGKSVMGAVLAENMAMAGARTCLLPLEMNAEEVTQRNLSRIADVDLVDLVNIENMERSRKKQVWKAYREHQRRLEKRGGKYSIIDPKFDPTMENTLDFVKPLGFDVVIIDYVGLMSGVGGDDQWQQLSRVTAYAKRWAELNGCIVIILVQVTDDGKVRYAQAMKEHASYAWIWGQPDRINNWILVQQVKARQARPFDFPLYMDFDRMVARDLTSKELQEYREFSGKADNDNANWKNKKKNKFADNDNDDDEEDVKPRPREKRASGSKSKRFEY